MPDVSHVWGGDLQVSATGDLLLADGVTLGEQRVLRRLLTNPVEYYFSVPYGAGLPKRVGALLDETAIISAIKSQLYQEDVVARTPAPDITVVQADTPGSILVTIQYVDAGSGQQATVAFDLSPP